jgi:hypothetical protein
VAAQLRRAGAADFGDFGDFHWTLINRLFALRDRLRPADPPETVPVLRFAVEDRDHAVVRLANVKYELGQFRGIVRAFSDGGLILQYAAPDGELCLDWVVNDILAPVGYTNAVPDPAELKRLRAQLQAKPSS